MKKSNLFKVFSILLIGAILLAIFNVHVLAATDNTDFTDITNTVERNNTNTNSSNTNRSNTNTNRSNTNTNNTNRITNNTASIYNDTSNLPQTGIEDSIPVALLVVVFGISAVYAYKKIKEYRNI